MIDFQVPDLWTIGLLVFLEGILSIDNAVVLAILAGSLPKPLQKKALLYGIVGAVAFRIIALGLANQLMKWVWVKFLGGGYLLYVGLAYFLKKKNEAHDENQKSSRRSFWNTVVMIELMDIAFAIDSILAAVAISPKLWVVVTGGLIGLVMMRFAATMFIRLLEVFPAFEESAYLLILVIGSKLVVDGFKIQGIDFHSSSSPASWIFWTSMGASIVWGFRRKRKSAKTIDSLHKQSKMIQKDKKFVQKMGK